MKIKQVDLWKNIKKIEIKNKIKLLNPFYNKRKFIEDKYFERMGKKIDLDNPMTFTEKLNYYKINKDIMKNYWRYVDKYEVRKYVENKIGKSYLIPQYKYVRKLKVKDLENLPDSFVIKTTSGSGTNYIVEDKKKENLKEICDYINWLSTIKYGYIWGEFLYNNVKRGIVIEKMLTDKDGNIPDDLKCFCFKDDKGVRRKILYVERVIGDERYRIMFDEKWNIVNYGCSFGKLDIKLEKPSNYKEILKVIDKLSEDFNFVRVDLFVLDKKIYFGELTFIPTAGYLSFDDEKNDKLWGSWISLKK